jgi:putative cobalt transporter subunit CbtA
MVRTFLVRGMLVGMVAGLLSFGFLRVYGEPQVESAVAFETQQDEPNAAAKKSESHMHLSDRDENELVSRSVQAGLGLFVAVLVYSTAFGGLFGLAYAFAYGRISGALTPQALSAALAATGFVAIYLVPNLKYPANPPSVGEHETIGIRTAIYFLMIAISIAAMIASLAIKHLFVARFGEWNANLFVAGCYILLVGIAALLLRVW